MQFNYLYLLFTQPSDLEGTATKQTNRRCSNTLDC